METAGRAYLLFATITLVAMVSHAGWIDGQTGGHVVAAWLIVTAGIASFLALAAVLIGIPLALVTAAVAGVRRLLPKTRAEESAA